MENYKRPYMYRERPYDYRENLIREESRKRKNRKQLYFSIENIKNIEEKIKENYFEDFSNYIRFCIENKSISKEDIEICTTIPNHKEKRKQVCFSDDEILKIEERMKELECNNLNLFIRTIALK